MFYYFSAPEALEAFLLSVSPSVSEDNNSVCLNRLGGRGWDHHEAESLWAGPGCGSGPGPGPGAGPEGSSSHSVGLSRHAASHP